MNSNSFIKVQVLPKATQNPGSTKNFLDKFYESERIVCVGDIEGFKPNKEVKKFI
jgi:hypothetical protein